MAAEAPARCRVASRLMIEVIDNEGTMGNLSHGRKRRVGRSESSMERRDGWNLRERSLQGNARTMQAMEVGVVDAIAVLQMEKI